jgi:uncharacterized protein YPO0396
MARTSRADYLKHWQDLVLAIQENPGLSEILRLDENNIKLGELCELVKSRSNDQAVFKAKLQQATRDIESYVMMARKAATELHDMLRGIYGREAEKLAEFRLQPRRTQTQPRLVGEGLTEKTPPEPDGDPARTAAPETDAST